MCVNYTPKQLQGKLRHWGKVDEAAFPSETWPGYPAPIYTRDDDQFTQTPADLPFRGTSLARFGLISFRSSDPNKVRNTQNARSETVDKLWSYKPAWDRSQLCLVPMQRFFEPDWRSGKSIRTAIQRLDGDAFTVAGIWDRWIDKSSGEVIASFSMLTINADGHPVMSQFHKPGDEKRSLVAIPEELRDEWLEAKPERAKECLQPCRSKSSPANPYHCRHDQRKIGRSPDEARNNFDYAGHAQRVRDSFAEIYSGASSSVK